MKKSNFAKKSLGQNFLNSIEIRDKIVESAGDLTEKNVLEIGPGLGFLTTKLLKAGAHLTAIELDERSVKILSKDFEQKKHFTLMHGSILDLDLDEIFEQKNYSVVANIPYNITAPILKKLLAETKNRPDCCILMVQKEVAEKICRTKPGSEKITKTRTILQISVEIFAETENLFEVPRTFFEPVPNVDSAVIRVKIRDVPLVDPKLESTFFTVVNAGFSERRKKLKNSFEKFFGFPAEKILGSIDGNRRGETLDIAEWIEIAENFVKFEKK
ncbi:ribosomal RNA small subunit methyltransferase A [bacterium]|jgi:16S rRNA (adenine1518-N6/adenine1519-N6)-dimethyltransferase|nr:ribosomal RNA small subunit methyltransferase A [bacterium]MBT6831914.1 ribosomal RNA small subunit methyltransferase A [bacterium]MBT6996610.1 ribosomal RNA small subunit methyltransferase A [bacterium]MBT7773030.1 ribosomal RNA small subunit methyltransferase A [bacterium]